MPYTGITNDGNFPRPKAEKEKKAMTFDQFKTICDLAEKLTDIQFGTITRQEMLDWCEEFFRECDNEDDHFYAILKDGRTADKEFEPCKKSDLRTAYKVTYTFDSGTLWFLSNEAKKDEALLENEIEILVHLNDGDCSATAWGCDLTYDYVKINGDYRT